MNTSRSFYARLATNKMNNNNLSEKYIKSTMKTKISYVQYNIQRKLSNSASSNCHLKIDEQTLIKFHIWGLCLSPSFAAPFIKQYKILSVFSFNFSQIYNLLYNGAISKYVKRKHLSGEIIQWWFSYIYCALCCACLYSSFSFWSFK
jgi:hypothetical protein